MKFLSQASAELRRCRTVSCVTEVIASGTVGQSMKFYFYARQARNSAGCNDIGCISHWGI